jgi:hypothetical protein
MTTNYPTDLTDAQYEAILQIMSDNRKRKYTLPGPTHLKQ